uniref:AMP-activated protein kinase glycogen-binding domain-containing protein n=1 Tax=Compsopogon caeruleus TaxID=31354 RepID=A0A7S1XD93_9RHOD|mmetsp:Transcript_14128/g.28917  ORF Transcript_14128/g.28917 Transcript_14128/m.28917 type:complete len:208 (+) Transcript_14128:484-1107(+)|eukprot:CAMPEP_0184678130 /NCGR_PEP_ID=MMETSP0312-20130426/806_1 /TAXON_ID=31354 /ORGANISM="Compsopogon coeruleus, Strain SAG 36.94" /LENGTH=207 /DNA_ID=CAMNT_0027126591 /DNA_START=494 /DNA_END=1117 /DNA_ORIENTATION=-
MSINPFQNRQVRTEFIYAEQMLPEFAKGDGGGGGGAARGLDMVALCGDWNHWTPIPMIRDLRDRRVWAVITLVPAGYHEFCYIVNGEHRVSTGHPLTADESCNWRYVKGPPRRDKASRYGPMSKLGFIGYWNELLCRVTTSAQWSGEEEVDDDENDLEIQMIRFRRRQFLIMTIFVVSFIFLTTLIYLYVTLRVDRKDVLNFVHLQE